VLTLQPAKSECLYSNLPLRQKLAGDLKIADLEPNSRISYWAFCFVESEKGEAID
jgi:hypothetical protein